MTIDDIIVGTVGEKNWIYKYASPISMQVNLSTRPTMAIGIPILDENSYPGDYTRYLIDTINKYCTVIKNEDGWTITTNSSYPRFDLKTYKMAFMKYTSGREEGAMHLYCYDGENVRQCHYNDIEVIGREDAIFANIWGHASGIGNYILDGASVVNSGEDNIQIYYGETSEFGVEFTNRVPVFYDESSLYDYLVSEDPDPTNFGGYWILSDYEYEGGDVPEDDLNTPGDEIGGIFSDLGLNFGTSTVKALVLTDDQLEELSQIISIGWYGGNIGDALISTKIFKLPDDIITVSEEPVEIVFKDLPGDAIDSKIRGRLIQNQFQKFYFGSHTIPEPFNSFLDYTNTSISIYLPFSGLHQLDTTNLIGSTISLILGVDYLTGAITWYINVNRNGIQQILYTFDGSCAMEIPITAIDYAQKITQMMSGLMTVTSGAIRTSFPTTTTTVSKTNTVTRNNIQKGDTIDKSVIRNNNNSVTTNKPSKMEGLSSMGGGVNNILQSVTDNYMTLGNNKSNNGWTGVMYPYLIFTRSNVSYPNNYSKNYGYPCMKNARLGSLNGFTVVDEIHLDGINCLEDERAELLSLLKSGVIL